MFGLAVRFPESARNDVEPIRDILIPSPSGALIPLGQLANVYVAKGPAQISREMGQRRIVIECNVTERDIGSFVQEAKQKIDNAVRLPPGYLMSWGGQYENQQRAMKRCRRCRSRSRRSFSCSAAHSIQSSERSSSSSTFLSR